jgi:hypothetical protein
MVIMALLPETITPTVEAIYKHYETSAYDWRRPHLGASIIGTDCRRSLWYTFRWALAPNFEGRILRLFESGQLEEARLIKNLRAIGITVWDRDQGKQISFVDFGGHYSGSVDAIGRGFKESSKPHIIEIKTSNLKGFKVLQKKGVKETKPLHYAQMVQYMEWADLDRAAYICICKDDDSIYFERLHKDKPYADILKNKAESIIFSDTPPEKLGESENSFCCKWCNYKSLCWESALPLVNCRTCANSTPEKTGGWSCSKKSHVLSESEQKHGNECPLHIFNPHLVNSDAVDASEEEGWILYADGRRNGPGYLSSEEM